MVYTTNTKGKRKNEVSDVKIEPAMKALKKNDLILQFRALQEKYKAIEDQNTILLQEKKNHIEAILLLEETVIILEKKTSKVEQRTSSAQTEIIWCEECEFPAETINDLVFHMYEFHTLEEEAIQIKCNFCSDKFSDTSGLMRHKKLVHSDNV